MNVPLAVPKPPKASSPPVQSVNVPLAVPKGAEGVVSACATAVVSGIIRRFPHAKSIAVIGHKGAVDNHGARHRSVRIPSRRIGIIEVKQAAVARAQHRQVFHMHIVGRLKDDARARAVALAENPLVFPGGGKTNQVDELSVQRE